MKNKIIIVSLIYVVGVISGVLAFKKLNPPATISENTKSQSVEQYTETIKKKDGTIVERKGVIALNVESKKLIEVEKQDNFKLNFDSSLRAGVEIKPYELLPIWFIPKKLWVGYEKDLRTGEDIGRISYSTRFDFWH